MIITTLQTPNGPVSIRPSRLEDAPAYRELRLSALLAHPEAFSADYETSAARPIDYWQERMQKGAGDAYGIHYLAEAGGELVGTTSLVRNDMLKTQHSASIFGVYVREDWRGAGIAEALLNACVAYAQELGLRLIRLGVVTTNTSALRLYQRCGFRVYSVEPESMYVDGVYHDELMLMLRVGGIEN